MCFDKASLSGHIAVFVWSPARALAFLKSQTQRAFVMPALFLYFILRKNLRIVYEEYHSKEYDEHWDFILENIIIKIGECGPKSVASGKLIIKF